MQTKHFPFWKRAAVCLCPNVCMWVYTYMYLCRLSAGHEETILKHFFTSLVKLRPRAKSSFEMSSRCWANVDILFPSLYTQQKRNLETHMLLISGTKELNQQLKEELVCLKGGSSKAEWNSALEWNTQTNLQQLHMEKIHHEWDIGNIASVPWWRGRSERLPCADTKTRDSKELHLGKMACAVSDY